MYFLLQPAVDGSDSARLTKAKKRRLRKKRLHQGPQEDGGEAQADPPPDLKAPVVAESPQSVSASTTAPSPQQDIPKTLFPNDQYPRFVLAST